MPHPVPASRQLPVLVWQDVMPRRPDRPAMEPVQRPAQHGLYKLVLTVAQACNLRCTYCYAEGGPYGEDVSRMSEGTARGAVREFFRRYRPIRTLQFFGGEPSLNLAAMRAAVDEVRAMVTEGGLEAEPQYAIVTNGYSLPDELLRFYQDVRMQLTVSHDGPAEVQDALRPTVRGASSCERVDANLARLREAGVQFDVQCTYTRTHSLYGYTVPRLLRYFAGLGAAKINIVPVTVPGGSELDVFYSDVFAEMVDGYREAVRLSFASLETPPRIRFGMLEEAMSLLRPGQLESKHYCSAGVSTLTVAANGDVYPCFMFINKDGFRLGNIREGHELAAFARDPERADFGCPGRQFMMNGSITAFRPDEVLKHAVIETVIECLEGTILQQAQA